MAFIDLKYVVCGCGSKRFYSKETFAIQKRDLGVRNDKIIVSRVSDEDSSYYCAECHAPVDLKKFINSR